jgi:hypothetical protein
MVESGSTTPLHPPSFASLFHALLFPSSRLMRSTTCRSSNLETRNRAFTFLGFAVPGLGVVPELRYQKIMFKTIVRLATKTAKNTGRPYQGEVLVSTMTGRKE